MCKCEIHKNGYVTCNKYTLNSGKHCTAGYNTSKCIDPHHLQKTTYVIKVSRIPKDISHPCGWIQYIPRTIISKCAKLGDTLLVIIIQKGYIYFSHVPVTCGINNMEMEICRVWKLNHKLAKTIKYHILSYNIQNHCEMIHV